MEILATDIQNGCKVCKCNLCLIYSTQYTISLRHTFISIMLSLLDSWIRASDLILRVHSLARAQWYVCPCVTEIYLDDMGKWNSIKSQLNHDDVINIFPRYWPFVWGIHRTKVNSPLKEQWRGARYGPCVGNSPVTGEFPSQRLMTRSFDVFFDQRLNKLLGKQSWSLWFETPSRS